MGINENDGWLLQSFCPSLVFYTLGFLSWPFWRLFDLSFSTLLDFTLLHMSTIHSGGSNSKESACSAEGLVWSLSWEDPLVKGMDTNSSILAWRIPWTEEPGGLEPLGSLWVRLDGSDLAHTHARSVYRFQCYSFNSSHLLFPPAVSTRFFSMSVSLLPVCTFKFNFIWLPCVLDGAWGIFDLRCRMWATRELF